MKIAFDVQGTLEGRYSERVVALFHAYQAKGHECYVWSFGGSIMARDAADGCAIKPVACISKRDRDYYYDDDNKFTYEDPEFDVCVDDDIRTAPGLSAGRVIYVHDIPDNNNVDDWNEFLTALGIK